MNISENLLTGWEWVWNLVKRDADKVSWVVPVPLFPFSPPVWHLWPGFDRSAHVQCGHLLCFAALQNLLKNLFFFWDFFIIWIHPTPVESRILTFPDSLATGCSHVTGLANKIQTQERFLSEVAGGSKLGVESVFWEYGGRDLWLLGTAVCGGVLMFRA